MPREPHPSVLFVACGLVVPVALSLGRPGCGGQWEDRPFQHGWALVGQHEGLACDACHPADASIGPVSSACEACHEADRPEAHYPGEGCGACHTPTGWDDGVAIDHAFFPLAGSHALDCGACHEAGTYEGLDPACSACHEDDRPQDHFVGECSDCHVPTTWSEASEVDHGAFPLAGAHALGCVACHADGVFEGRDPACVACHEDDRPSPEHHPGEDCGACHTPTAWSDVVVDHDVLPLTDAHALPCDSCHLVPGVYGGLDATCATCHATAVPDDKHNDGEDCGFCHVATRWSDTTFDHGPVFPIPHHGANVCVDCHPAQPDYGPMSCLDACHDHDQAKMDDKHTGVAGYTWDSAACYDCHPDGKKP